MFAKKAGHFLCVNHNIYYASNLPSGATFDPNTQVFSWTPSVGQAGSYGPEFTVTNGAFTVIMTVNILVIPQVTDVTAIGIIKDSLTGEPLSGANVSITDSEKTQSTITLSNGSYSISGISTGTAQIIVSLEGYSTGIWQTNYSEPGIWRTSYELTSASALSTIQGSIINSATLQPEEGVTITLYGTNNSCVTLADGTFVLSDVPYGEQTLYIAKENFQNSFIPLLVDKDPYEMDLAIPYRIVNVDSAEINNNITGIVTDGIKGLPIEGAIVKVIGTSIEASTDQEGQFSLTDLPDGRIIIMAMALNHEAVIMYPVVVSNESETFSFSLTPTINGTIIGTITDVITGEPIRNARISIGEGALAGAETEPDGTFKMLTVPIGDYTVTASHPSYIKGQKSSITVPDNSSVIVDFALTLCPHTGSLQGIIIDKDSQETLSDVVITAQETGESTITDVNGNYLLNDLPTGLVTLSINVQGYPDTTRITAVNADVDEATLTVTTYDIALDQADPSPPDTVSVLITAEEGGSIESPDKRFMIVIPAGALSNDAIITLMPPTTGPEVYPGDSLDLDPQLGERNVTALGEMIQIAIEPSVDGAEVPTINNWVVLAGRYFQSIVEALNLDESTVFPYYWNGTTWTLMQIKPYEFAVDEINNQHVAAVNFSVTESGDLIAVDLSSKKPVLLASIGDHIPDLAIARLYTFMQAAVVINDLLNPPPNAYIYDKDELIIDNMQEDEVPNVNALPLLMIHGWTKMAAVWNQGQTDPNINPQYKYMIEDIVTAFNGVYRPVFGTYNPRSGIVDSGNSLANAFKAKNIKGDPSNTPGSTGAFPYFDTFGYSMGGLVARTFQISNHGVHNMVMTATPNHGTFPLINLIGINNLTVVAKWSPGTKDLFPYDDSAWSAGFSGNPTLYNLNRSSSCIPRDNMTLIAGTKGILAPLWGANDKVVSVDSVFCRTSAEDDDYKSLLKVNLSAEKSEHTAEFSHTEFSTDDYRIKEHPEVYNPIKQGFSDWVVGKSTLSNIEEYDDHFTISSAEYSVDVQYNVWNGDNDRVVLVIYAMDGNNQWHVSGTYVDEAGTVTFSEPIDGNSKGQELVQLHTSALFAEEDGIWKVECALISLKPGQTKVSLEPSAGFAMPEN